MDALGPPPGPILDGPPTPGLGQRAMGMLGQAGGMAMKLAPAVDAMVHLGPEAMDNLTRAPRQGPYTHPSFMGLPVGDYIDALAGGIHDSQMPTPPLQHQLAPGGGQQMSIGAAHTPGSYQLTGTSSQGLMNIGDPTASGNPLQQFTDWVQSDPIGLGEMLKYFNAGRPGYDAHPDAGKLKF
jgi:hypothetical protein